MVDVIKVIVGNRWVVDVIAARRNYIQKEIIKGIAAKAVTPFLLGRIFELTDGASLTANIALVRNNARLAAQIAGSLIS